MNLLQLDWRHDGYFTFPLTEAAQNRYDIAEVEVWSDFAAVLQQAKTGNVHAIQQLFTIYDETDNWLLARACTDLFADAASGQMLRELMGSLLTFYEPTYVVHWAQALCTWGHLSAVPVVLDALRMLDGFDDAEDLAADVLRLLSVDEVLPEVPRRGFGDFIASAESRYDRYVTLFGTEDVILFRGEQLSVSRMAVRMLSRIHTNDLEPLQRHKVEAYTGVDCRPFVANDSTIELKVSLLQNVLSTANAFLPSMRYFFGHALPS